MPFQLMGERPLDVKSCSPSVLILRWLQFLIQPLQSHSLREFRYLSKNGAIYGTQAYSPKLHDPEEAQEEAAALSVLGALLS